MVLQDVAAVCQNLDKQMPYWMQILTMMTSTLISLLVFGPVTMKPTTEAKSEYSPKSLFRWLLLVLFLHTLCINILEIAHILLAPDTTWWEKYTCTAITWLDSKNFVTAFSMRGMELAFEYSVKFPGVHNGEVFRVITNKVDTMGMFRSVNGTAAAWLFRASTYWFYPGIFALVPFHFIALLVYFPLAVTAILVFQLGIGSALALLAIQLKMRGFCLIKKLESEYQNLVTKKTETDAIRQLYINFDTEPVSASVPKGAKEADLLKQYERDLWAYQYTGTTFKGLQTYFGMGATAVVLSWSPMLTYRFLASMRSGGGFWHSWVLALSSTLGERHWYLYMDYVFSTINSSIMTFNTLL